MAKASGKQPEKNARVEELKREIDELQHTLALGVIVLLLVIGICYQLVRDGSGHNLVIGFFVGGVIFIALIGGIAGTNQIGKKRREIKDIIDAQKKNSA